MQDIICNQDMHEGTPPWGQSLFATDDDDVTGIELAFGDTLSSPPGHLQIFARGLQRLSSDIRNPFTMQSSGASYPEEPRSRCELEGIFAGANDGSVWQGAPARASASERPSFVGVSECSNPPSSSDLKNDRQPPTRCRSSMRMGAIRHHTGDTRRATQNLRHVLQLESDPGFIGIAEGEAGRFDEPRWLPPWSRIFELSRVTQSAEAGRHR